MALLSLFNDMCRKPTAARAEGLAEQAQHEVGDTKIHMDLDLRHRASAGARDRQAGGPVLRLPDRLHGGDVGHRADADGRRCSSSVFMRYEDTERWTLVIPYAVVLVLAI